MRHREDGQGLVEYGMVLALVAMVAVVGVRALGVTITGFFSGLQLP